MDNGLTNYYQFVLTKKIHQFLYPKSNLQVDDLSEYEIGAFAKLIRARFHKKFSTSTLKRMLRSKDYDFNRTDKRVVKNLDLVARQLKYKNWQTFINANRRSVNITLRNPFVDEAEISRIAYRLQMSMSAEFAALKNLPDVDMSEIQSYFLAGDGYLLSLEDYLLFKQSQSAYLFTPLSSYKIEIANISFIYENIAMASIQIQSSYCWKHTSSQVNLETNKTTVTRVIFMHKLGGDWYATTDAEYYLGLEQAFIYTKNINSISAFLEAKKRFKVIFT